MNMGKQIRCFQSIQYDTVPATFQAPNITGGVHIYTQVNTQKTVMQSAEDRVGDGLQLVQEPDL